MFWEPPHQIVNLLVTITNELPVLRGSRHSTTIQLIHYARWGHWVRIQYHTAPLGTPNRPCNCGVSNTLLVQIRILKRVFGHICCRRYGHGQDHVCPTRSRGHVDPLLTRTQSKEIQTFDDSCGDDFYQWMDFQTLQWVKKNVKYV